MSGVDFPPETAVEHERRVEREGAAALEHVAAAIASLPAAPTPGLPMTIPAPAPAPVAIERRPQLDSDGIVPFHPTNTQEMFRYATFLAKSELVPKALQGKPYNVLYVLLKGEELGLTPMQATSSLHIIDGKVELSAQLIVGLIRRSGLCDYWTLIVSTGEIATYETLRKGDPQPVRMSYTREEAIDAGLANKDNWRRMMPVMLRRRCQTTIGREVYPEITLGLYDEGELQEMREGYDTNTAWREPAIDAGAIDLVPPPPAAPASTGPRDPLRERLDARKRITPEVKSANQELMPWEDNCTTCGKTVSQSALNADGKCAACSRR